jgi:hypothetical protein
LTFSVASFNFNAPGGVVPATGKFKLNLYITVCTAYCDHCGPGQIDSNNQLIIQSKPLNLITDNVIVRLMQSNCHRLSRSQITNKKAFCFSRRLLIVIIRLMLSLSLCPKVITLSGFPCNKQT